MSLSIRSLWGVVFLAVVSGCGETAGGPTNSQKSDPLGAASRNSWTATGATAPVSTVAGVAMATVRVAITDSANEVVPSSTLPVTLSVSGNTAPLSGTTTVNAVGGIATFSDLVITKVGTYRLIASAPGMLSGTSVAFTITAAPADHLDFTMQPTPLSAGALFSPLVQVSALDAYGNPSLTPTSITVALGDNPGAGTLTGTTTLNTTTGRATFSSLRLNRPGNGYSLTASSAGLPTILSGAFDVLLGPASRFIVVSGSGQAANVGQPVTFPLIIESQDAAGNKVPGAPVEWVVAIGNGTVTPGSTTTDATTARAQATMVLGTTSGSQRVEARASGVTTGVFTFTGRALAASQFAIVSGDGQSGTAGEPLAAPLVVAVTDVYGNPVASQVVTFSVGSGGGAVVAAAPRTDATGRVSATATLGAIAGANEFHALKAGLSRVTFTATGVPGAPSLVAFAPGPVTAAMGEVMAPMTVTVSDARGNAIDGATVALSLAGGAAGAVLSGTTTATTVGGSTAFTDLAIDRIGDAFTLTASAGAVSQLSAAFDITCTAGLTACAGQCIDATADLNNCGACGTVCGGPHATGAACVAGACQVTGCQAGRGDCDAVASNGCETDVATAPRNCGACGRSCPAGVMCVQGMCGGDDAASNVSASGSRGPWSYGSIPLNGSLTFTAFTTGTTDGSGNQVWNDGSSEPSVTFNGTGAPTSVNGGSLPDQSLALMPGTSSSAVLRYTAQAAGTYRVYTDFEALVDTTTTTTLSETRCRAVKYCRPYYFLCIHQAAFDTSRPLHSWQSCDNDYGWNCGETYNSNECTTQTSAPSHPLRSTPVVQVRVNGLNAWGSSSLNDATESSFVHFGWDPNWYSAGFPRYYFWGAGDPRQHGALTLTLNAGDAVDFAVAPGGFGNTADLTRVSARFELACGSGLADCDGDASNGCETDLAMEGGSCGRASVAHSSGGLEASGATSETAISGDGRFIVFTEWANNLVAGASSGIQQIYLRDLQTGLTTLVSHAADGGPGDGESRGPAMSPDGRWVAFASAATNLGGGGNPGSDVFVFDRVTNTLAQIDMDASGAEANSPATSPSISDDGRFVSFTSAATNLDPAHPKSSASEDAFIKDRASGVVLRVTAPGNVEPDGASTSPQLSGDGSSLIFTSAASNLVAGDTNSLQDVFAFDVASGAMERLNFGLAGEANGPSYLWGVAVSRTGKRVTFLSYATNLGQSATGWHAYLVDRDTHLLTNVAQATHSSVSADGRWLTVVSSQQLTTDDLNGRPDAFVLDLTTATWSLASSLANTARTSASVSSARVAAAGRHVLFTGAGRGFSASTGSNNQHPFVAALLRPPEVYVTRAPTTQTAGGTFSIDSMIFDERGNAVRVSGIPVTLELAQGPAGATFAPMTVNTTRGASTFTLSLQTAGAYSFTLSAPGYASRTFGPLTVTTGAPAAITLVSGDAQTATVASVLSPFVVRVVDAFANPIAGHLVDWSVVQGLGSITPASSTTDAAGETTALATLSTVSGANSFVATSGTLTAAFSAIGVAGAPAALTWSVQPSTTTAGVVMAPAPTLALVDAYGNLVDNLSDSATVGWRHGGIELGGQPLQGTTTVALTGGFAVFPAVYAHEAGTDFFSGVTGGLGALSDPVTILPGPVSATLSSVTALASTAEANGVAAISILVYAADQFGNAITGALPDVVVSGNGNLLTQPGPTLAGGATASLASTRAETKTISATINGVALATTTQVTFTPLSTCIAETSDCNGDSTDGCETDLTAVASCGACGVACGGGMACTAGSCACPSATPTACGSGPTGYCANLTADPANCGGCGAACAAGQACTAQGCTDTCAETQPPDEVVAIELEPTGGNLVPGVVDTATFRVFGRMRRTPWQRVDVSAQATFSSSNTSTVDVSAVGVAQSPAGTTGTETLSATVNGHTATARVRVWDPARYAQLTALTLSAPGHHMHVPIGTCFPVQCTATFSDTSTEDVSETVDFAVVGLGSPASSSRQPEMRVMDQNLLTISGAPFQNPDIGRYVDLLGQLVPGGLTSPRITGYVGGKGGTCADSRSPGSIAAVATSPNAPALYTDQTVELRTAALHADFSIRDVSTQSQLRTCAPTTLHVARDGWITGLSAGPALVTTTVGALVGHTPVTVYGTHPSLGTLTEFRLRPAAANVEPGQPFDLRGVASYTGTGTALFNVTSQTTWTSSNTAISPVPVLGRGVGGTTIGTSDITATFDGVTTTGAVRTWTPGRLSSITSVSVIRPALYQAQGTCAQLVLRATFNNTPTDFEDLTRNATWWQGWKCFGDLSPSGLFWTRGPFCSSGVYLDLYGSMGFGLPGGQTVINSSATGGMADDFRDPVSCP